MRAARESRSNAERSLIQREKLLSQFRLSEWNMAPQFINAHRAVLKATLRECGHVDAGDCLHATRYDLAFERIKLVYAVVGECDEGDSFRDADNVRAHERAETFEAKFPRR